VLQRGPFDEFAKHVFEKHPKTVILVDESDREWMEPGQAEQMPNFIGFIARGKPLVHLQTFSHVFGLTGLRAGYLFAPARLVERMKAKRTANPVNVLGRVAALAALKDADSQIDRCRKLVSEGRNYIYSELDEMGLRYARSQGHYVMLDTGVSGTAVWSELIAQGVLTRYGREWGKEGWLRVNPGLPEENERFIASLRAALGKADPSNPPTPPVPLGGRSAEAALVRRDLERRLRRDAWIESRMPRLERPYRVVTSDLLQR
jgi:histidinol-phosphate aminotransferase